MPPIYVAGSGPTTARMAGDLGDGFVTVYEDPDTVTEELFPAVEHGVAKSDHNDSDDDVEKTIHIHCSYAETEHEALESCLPWLLTLLPMVFEQNISDPRYLQEHGDLVSAEALKDFFVVTTDTGDLLDIAETYVDIGFDHIVFHSSSPDQEAFCEAVAKDVMSSFS